MTMKVDAQAQSIIDAIHAAFLGVRRGAVTLHEAKVIDDYGTDAQRADARKLDTDGRWERVPDSHIEKSIWALSHLDPESWRYYIAPFMIWSLRNFRVNHSPVPDFTIYTLVLSDDSPSLREYSLQRFASLNDQQSRCVCRYLRYMALQGGHADDRAAREALQKYWHRYCHPDLAP